MSYKICETLIGTYEEEFKGFLIFIESNPDRVRGGFEWSVCKDECEFHADLAFTVESAIKYAKEVIESLLKN